jgi:DNA-binding transcriptional LysR family regulator
MNLQQLRYFLAAVELGSFSAAADELHMAQPSLSEQVRRLEGELGVALFQRVGRGLVVTDAVEDAREAVREVRELEAGTVTLGTFGNAPYYLLADVIAEFRRRHPAVNVEVIGQNSTQVADGVRNGALEAGLVVLPLDDRGLEIRPIMRDEIVYLTNDPDRAKRPVTIEMLSRAPLILYDARFGWDDPTRRQLRERAQRAGVVLEPQIEVEYMTAALDLTARGLGDTVGSRSVLTARGYARRLGVAPFDPPLYETFAFITRRNAHLSPATREFMKLAERRVQALA